jgi:hypothetical protein
VDEILIIKVIFGILLLLGSLILVLLSFKVYYKYLVQQKKCTSKTKGIIKKYTLSSRGGENSGVHLPVVSYVVNNEVYKVIGPEYRSYKIITKSNPFAKNNMEFEEIKDTLIIYRQSNSVVEICKNPLEKLYPLNSTIDVYYNPNKPKQSYVLRYCNKKWMFYLTFSSALVLLIIDFCILFLL